MAKNTKSQDANNQRANQMNPNNPAYKAGQDNRANQLNPNNWAHRSGRSQGEGNNRVGSKKSDE